MTAKEVLALEKQAADFTDKHRSTKFSRISPAGFQYFKKQLGVIPLR